MKKEYINTDEVPQDKFDNTEGGGSNGHSSANESEEVSINWWYIASIALALAAAVIIALIV
jgi:hypothetical protein